MNYSLLILEILVVALGLGLLLFDLWAPREIKKQLGYVAAAGLGLVLVLSFSGQVDTGQTQTAFQGMYVQDSLALFFKRVCLVAAIVVLVMTVEYSDRITAGISEYYALTLFALAGMMFAVSSNELSLLFVSVELMTVTFYVLTSFQRSKLVSLEAGVKYLILGALSSAFLVFGIAFVFGVTGETQYPRLSVMAGRLVENKVFLIGWVMILAGLAFKIAAFPFQVWAPDVYQGSPTPTTAFLAVGSKAAGFAMLLRFLFGAAPEVAKAMSPLLAILAGVTILYGNLCAIPQRNLKRLLGYSSISNAGYLLLGVAALSATGQSAVLVYLVGYLFTVLTALMVVAVVLRDLGAEDLSGLAGLNRRSPFLAASLTLAMVSLAGIPPLAGFFGKFLLLKSVFERAAVSPAYYALIAVAVAGVVISLYYYFGVVRAIYWSREAPDLTPITVSKPVRISLAICVLLMVYLGLAPSLVYHAAEQAVKVLRF